MWREIKVLLIDDDAGRRHDLKVILDFLGEEVITADTADWQQTVKQQVEDTKRSEERCPIHMLDVPLQVTHPDGAVAKFLICLRNISSGGMSFRTNPLAPACSAR